MHTARFQFPTLPSMTPAYWTQATQELAARDAVMQRLIAQFADASLELRGCAFTTLARSIIGQQISVKAAESVWQRVIAAIPEITPLNIAATEQELLRSCGLSARKIIYF